MKSMISIVILFFVYCAAWSHAEVLVLKTGQEVEGKIIGKTDDSLKIMLEDIAVTYYMDEIKHIEKEILVDLLEDGDQRLEEIKKIKKSRIPTKVYTINKIQKRDKSISMKESLEKIDPLGQPGDNIFIQSMSPEEWSAEYEKLELKGGNGMTDIVEENEEKAIEELEDTYGILMDK